MSIKAPGAEVFRERIWVIEIRDDNGRVVAVASVIAMDAVSAVALLADGAGSWQRIRGWGPATLTVRVARGATRG